MPYHLTEKVATEEAVVKTISVFHFASIEALTNENSQEPDQSAGAQQLEKHNLKVQNSISPSSNSKLQRQIIKPNKVCIKILFHSNFTRQ